MKKNKDVISDEELYACPVDEKIMVMDSAMALQILRMDLYSMEDSFLTPMHREMLNHMLQRGTMAKYILFTPNFCAELFTLSEFKTNERYIVNKLVGRYDYDGRRIECFETLQRQTLRKVAKLIEKTEESHLIFFWDRNPNLIYVDDNKWKFHPDSPAYKSLVKAYGKFDLVRKK